MAWWLKYEQNAMVCPWFTHDMHRYIQYIWLSVSSQSAKCHLWLDLWLYSGISLVPQYVHEIHAHAALFLLHYLKFFYEIESKWNKRRRRTKEGQKKTWWCCRQQNVLGSLLFLFLLFILSFFYSPSPLVPFTIGLKKNFRNLWSMRVKNKYTLKQIFRSSQCCNHFSRPALILRSSLSLHHFLFCFWRKMAVSDFCWSLSLCLISLARRYTFYV